MAVKINRNQTVESQEIKADLTSGGIGGRGRLGRILGIVAGIVGVAERNGSGFFFFFGHIGDRESFPVWFLCWMRKWRRVKRKQLQVGEKVVKWTGGGLKSY